MIISHYYLDLHFSGYRDFARILQSEVVGKASRCRFHDYEDMKHLLLCWLGALPPLPDALAPKKVKATRCTRDLGSRLATGFSEKNFSWLEEFTLLSPVPVAHGGAPRWELHGLPRGCVHRSVTNRSICKEPLFQHAGGQSWTKDADV